MSARIQIEYDMIENSMRFKVDASEFRGMSAQEIMGRIRELVDEDAGANVSFYPENVRATVASIQSALADEQREMEASEG